MTLTTDDAATIAAYWSERPWIREVAKQRGHVFTAASVQQLCDEDDAAWDDFRAHHRPAWDDEGDVYGDPVGYGRTSNDDRLRAIFWLLVVPMYLLGMSILGWAVGTALREWLR